MATVLEGVLPKSSVMLCIFFVWVKRFNANIFIKKHFLFTMRSVSSVERFTAGWKMFCWWRNDWNGGAEVAETRSKDFYAASFDALVKRLDKMYQCWWKICRKIFFSKFEYHMFYFLYQFVTYLLTLPCITSSHGSVCSRYSFIEKPTKGATKCNSLGGRVDSTYCVALWTRGRCYFPGTIPSD
jgi:hypothetical protein